MTTDVFVEKFNTKVDVCKAIGIRFLHTTLIEYFAKNVHDKEFKDLTEAQKNKVEKYSEERYLDFLMLRNAGKQHDHLSDDHVICQHFSALGKLSNALQNLSQFQSSELPSGP